MDSREEHFAPRAGICNTREPEKCNVNAPSSQQRSAHRQFDNIFKSRNIKEKEVTLELIHPKFSGK